MNMISKLKHKSNNFNLKKLAICHYKIYQTEPLKFLKTHNFRNCKTQIKPAIFKMNFKI